MTAVAQTVEDVIRVPHTWIPVSDGTRLGARLWLPPAVEAHPVPAVLEVAPYRKDDYLARRDESRYAYLAGNGFACVRVDLRGTGSSEGLLLDEYLPREQQDTLEVISWIAEQAWCTGAVGMLGKSWGGFAALQAAARRPAALRAIVVVAASDDRYEEDAHYMGGCLLACELLPWAARVFAYNARPPDPQVVGDRWRSLWRERLDGNPLFAEAWLRHQRRDPYWDEGSVSTDYSRIECPVLLVGGWHDPYRHGLLRLLERLDCPRRAVVGPWSHQYPDQATPGPRIGFLQECRRWYDHWLGGRETGVMEEPLLRAWMPEPARPGELPGDEAGRWIAEDSWPPPSARRASFALAGERLTQGPVAIQPRRVEPIQSIGLGAGLWIPDREDELPRDQRGDEKRSATYTSDALDERLEILGVPEVELLVSSDRPAALVAVRLADVCPDGASRLVTRGLLNLTHREGSAWPVALPIDVPLRVRVPLKAIAHAFAASHRIRVAVSGTYWPWAWPSPEAPTLTVHAGTLTLPVRPPGARDEDVGFEPPVHATPPDFRLVTAGETGVSAELDARGRHVLRVERDIGGHRVLAHGLEIAHWAEDTFAIDDGDPLAAEVRSAWRILLARDGWRTEMETEAAMTADGSHFHVTSAVEARENGKRVAARDASFSVARDYV